MKYLPYYLVLAGWLCACSFQSPKKPMNGVCLEMPPRPITQKQMTEIKRTGANWVAMIPYAFIRRENSEVIYQHEGHWWGESYKGTAACIAMAREAGLQVMMKPHVWVSGQGWAGDFVPRDEADWKLWEESNRNYILKFALLADSMKVEVLCIGTEYRKTVVQRPDYWRKLIKDVREVYSGKVTYAANWDNYHNVVFWDDLDYIGVDAYFPLSRQKEPSPEDLKRGWDSVKVQLKEWSDKYRKPILFTEYGYKSIDYTNSGHWNYHEDTVSHNFDNQARAYEALMTATWDEPWMAGGFFWKWHFSEGHRHRDRTKDYTPQNKPAEEVIKEWYTK